jgi:uncharacterized protein with ATP-grasp and redox domains
VTFYLENIFQEQVSMAIVGNKIDINDGVVSPREIRKEFRSLQQDQIL